MNMLVPCWLNMTLSLMSFWGDPCSISDRAGITLTLLLTQTASMQYIQDSLPDVPYLTFVEYVVLASELVLACQGLAQMRVCSLCDDTNRHQGMLVDRGVYTENIITNTDSYPLRAQEIDQFAIAVTCACGFR